MTNWTNRNGVLVMDSWLTGIPAEDENVVQGLCPWQTGLGGWG